MYINGIKYACITCIKGHRSSSCSHVERPLIEIRKKGRPPNHCKDCKNKTKKPHIQCGCKKDSPPLSMYPTPTMNPACLAHSDNMHPCICPTSQPFASNVSQEFTRESLMSAPLCTTTPLVKQENWTPQVEAFPIDTRYRHPTSSKPTNASRILDGQPRVHRRSPKTSPYAMTPPMPYTEPMMNFQQDVSLSQCGSLMPSPNCFPPNVGESVVITITPISQDLLTTTRIVTCYCGSQCTCPGCLVHPSTLGEPSTSSSCNGSDDDMSIYSHFF